MNITIRPVEHEQELLSVYRFRYQVYVEEMGRSQANADHERRIIREPLDEHARILAAFEPGGRIVGTIRSNFSVETPDLGCYSELYRMREAAGGLHPGHTSVTTKFMVAREYRRSTLSMRLARAIYVVGLSNHIRLDFIDCNPHLEAYFRGLGYLPYMGRVHHHEYGDVLPMVLNLTDRDHLERVRSPFLGPLRAHGDLQGCLPCDRAVVRSLPVCRPHPA